MRRGWKLGIALAVVLAVGLGALALLWPRDGDGAAEPAGPDGPPVEEVDAYLTAWAAGEWGVMGALVLDPPSDFADVHQAVVDDLLVTEARYEPGDVTLASEVGPSTSTAPDAPRATAPFRATLTLEGLGDWTYEGVLDLVWASPAPSGDGSTTSSAAPEPPRWLVDWAPQTIHPELAPGFSLARTRTWESRGPILDDTGAVLVGAATVVEVGVEPRRIDDRDDLATAVEKHLGVTRAELDAALDAPGVQPDYFVPIAQLTPEEWDAVRDAVLPVPGVIFREQTARTGPPPGFAQPLLGRTGEATAEQLDERGSPYRVGDVVGSGGVEGTYERRLAGTPTGDVTLVSPEGETVGTLHHFPGVAPQPVSLTIDPGIQGAAEAAADGAPEPMGLVAIDARTGEIRAAVSRPSDGFDRALEGRYPPGSTFKIVTGTAALRDGVTPATIVPCPSSVEVGGRTFHNYESEALGDIPFQRAFQASCNTAFIHVADQAGADALEGAAADFGFEAPYEVGLSSFGGSFPDPSDRTENAAAAIGQGRVEASAMHMASVAAAVAAGTWRPPVLVTDPAPTDTPPPVHLEPGIVDTLRGLMRDVVVGGTGTAANIPGRDIHGKTGTAQFGDGSATHAWFVGFEGDLAFAVVVEGGGVGGQVAAPIARDFLADLP